MTYTAAPAPPLNLRRYWRRHRAEVVTLIRAAYKPEDTVVNARTLAWHAARAGTLLSHVSDKQRTQVIGSVIFRVIGSTPWGSSSYVLPVPVGRLR